MINKVIKLGPWLSSLGSLTLGGISEKQDEKRKRKREGNLSQLEVPSVTGKTNYIVLNT